MQLISGFTNNASPRTLINPVHFSSVEDLFKHLSTFLNAQDYILDPPLTMDLLEEKLKLHLPMLIIMKGYGVVIMAGHDDAIYDATDRFVHIAFPQLFQNIIA